MSVIDVLNYLEAKAITHQTFPDGTVEFLSTVTPDMARELLKANTVNRSFNKANIKKFAENMVSNT
jgi:hypothetical protein